MLMLEPASILMLEVSRGLLLRFQTGNAGSNLRNAPAHGRQLPTDENIVSIYRFVVAAMRVYFLRKMGFSEEQVFRMAQRHRGVREGLGLPQENLNTDAHNEMLKPGWIMEGRAIRERRD